MNNSQILNLKPGDKPLYDNQVTGLHLRAFTNKKVFYLFYRTKSGIQRRPKIGELGVLSLSQARDIAKKWLAAVALGGDPSKGFHDARNELTLDGLFTHVWGDVWSKVKGSKWGKEAKRLYEKNIRPHFGSIKLSDLTPIMVRYWMNTMEKTPYSANRALSVLSRMYSYAEEYGHRPPNTNPCTAVSSFPEKKRERFATPNEMRKIGEILRREFESHPQEVTFIFLLFLTGARPVAIESATLDKIMVQNMEDGSVWGTFSYDGKSGQEKILFPPSSLILIHELTRKFPNLKTITGIKMPRRFWEKVRTEAGCEDLWARDSRRTFATTGMSSGNEMEVISELLNHKSAQTTKIYAKLMDAARVSVAEKTSNEVQKFLGKMPGGKNDEDPQIH